MIEITSNAIGLAAANEKNRAHCLNFGFAGHAVTGKTVGLLARSLARSLGSSVAG